MRFRKVRLRRVQEPRAYFVNRPRPPAPGVAQTHVSVAQPFVADGWVFPRPSDLPFDFGIRVPNLAAGTTTTQRVFNETSLSIGGVIRKLGYFFSQPHGYLQVRTTILINGAPPARYLFRTVDAGAPTPSGFQGSLPPFQIGSPAGDEMAEVYIKLPATSVLDVSFVNNSATEAFSCELRLWGWLYTGETS